MSLWQELEGLQKKKSELDNQLLSIDEKAKTLEERLRTIEEEMDIKEERANILEDQLKERQEAVVNLESRIAGLELTLKAPVKEQVEEEAGKEPTEVTAPGTGSDDFSQEVEESKANQKKTKSRWL